MDKTKEPKTSKTRKKALTAKDLGVYINLLTDFGFKRVFSIKEVMLKFLNTVLDIEGGIKDLRYGNPEKLGVSQFERKAVYDLYCITGNDEHIIVEIQYVSQMYFKDRTLHYVARLINELSLTGKDWNYKLPKVYSVNILNFSLEEAVQPLGLKMKKVDENKFVSCVQLIDRDTGELFYDKLTFLYIELERFTKEFCELKSFFEQWIFIIKHLHELKDLPEELRNDEVFERIFEIAKIAKMTKKEVNNYLKDLNNMNIVRNEIRGLRNIISERDNALVQKDYALAVERNALQKANAKIAELEQRLNSSQ
jgi:predicted transposase/invertase (TIGR01784 family)